MTWSAWVLSISHSVPTTVGKPASRNALRLGGGLSADGVASLVLVAVAVVATAFAVPSAAGAIGAPASGAWPWWLMPVARRVTAWRVRRWAHPDELGRESVRARAAGRELRADRLDARRARTGPVGPGSPTWAGDRFRAAEARVRAETGTDIAGEWTKLLIAADDNARAALADTRAAYDAACEALAWSLAFVVLGAWWWPAALAGVVLWPVGRLSLRRAVEALCRTTEAVFALRGTEPPPP